MKDQQIVVRMESELVDRINRYGETNLRGAGMGRSAVVRLLLVKALNAEDRSGIQQGRSGDVAAQ
jgi:hypothetical protein